jgi:hypothetical protein
MAGCAKFQRLVEYSAFCGDQENRFLTETWLGYLTGAAYEKITLVPDHRFIRRGAGVVRDWIVSDDGLQDIKHFK